MRMEPFTGQIDWSTGPALLRVLFRILKVPGAYSISLPPKVVTNNLTNSGPI